MPQDTLTRAVAVSVSLAARAQSNRRLETRSEQSCQRTRPRERSARVAVRALHRARPQPWQNSCVSREFEPMREGRDRPSVGYDDSRTSRRNGRSKRREIPASAYGVSCRACGARSAFANLGEFAPKLRQRHSRSGSPADTPGGVPFGNLNMTKIANHGSFRKRKFAVR